MQITKRFVESEGRRAHVLTPIGRLIIGGPCLELREAIREILRHECKNVVITMAEVPYVDSSGMGELVSAYTTVCGKGGNLKIVALTPKLRDYLKGVKLDTVFDIFEDQDSALRSFPAVINRGRPASGAVSEDSTAPAENPG
ncbi:MAG: hypothetical protein A2751_02730 [Candidatus Doudnabacteria bacterium RIFCSPHIGHO2_01_FULL_46_14]|uniref:STAS domain-containing protein n=1 Tax=Candidatus Doudnabacteria bacterium RIFCSPHIGHO2_01_FULL_46_14 TaxID=1817824 RepID=A0A1F5NK59_9BACT|nr:MAG: hypothetical protein A2751_02730 [Candidatus Doudnabacteria bacterium RIFCSPHIGHO2_01_FULL_46_14]